MQRPNGLFVVLLLPLIIPCHASCPKQRLVRCRPSDLGVIKVELLGALRWLNWTDYTTSIVVLGAFIKVTRTAHEMRLMGYGWIDFLNGIQEYAPHHRDYIAHGLPALGLEIMVGTTWQHGLPIQVTRGTQGGGTDDKVYSTTDFGFRLEARWPATEVAPTTFALKVAEWPRYKTFSLRDCQELRGTVTPYFNMTSHAPAYLPVVHEPRGLPSRRLRQQDPQADWLPAAQSPLVAVVSVSYSGARGSERHMAQQILRHVEYHVLQAGMQRVLIYIREALYETVELREYLALHMPPAARHYVTFVVWNELTPIAGAPYWDQHMIYYHAAVALSAHASVFAAYIDLDEALDRCNTNGLHSIGLASMYTLCGPCAEEYYKTDMGVGEAADVWMWLTSERNSSNSVLDDQQLAEYCNRGRTWYAVDPLLQYTRTWDDTWWVEKDGLSWASRTSLQANQQYGKHITRVNAPQVFIHHRVELTDPQQTMVYVDPETCPYIAHLSNVNKYRGNHSRGGLPWFAKNWRSKWWILPDA